MRKIFSRFLLFALLTLAMLLPAGYCMAQDEDTVTVMADTTVSTYGEEEYIPLTEDEEEDVESNAEIEPILRTLSADSIAAIRKMPEFAYMTYLDSLLRAEQKVKDNVPEREEYTYEPPISFWDLGFVKLICWLAAIGLVGFVLYKLFLGQGIFFSNKKQSLPEVELDDTPDESDLEKTLRQALKKGDYRTATRYLFLITLSRLGERGILQLSTEKTNYQYATELAGKPYANRFAQLSLQYEYVWFGNFPINETQFAGLQQQHQQFLKEI